MSHAARKIREADTEARRIVSVNKGKVMHKTSFIHNKGVGDESVSPGRDVGYRAFIIDHDPVESQNCCSGHFYRRILDEPMFPAKVYSPSVSP